LKEPHEPQAQWFSRDTGFINGVCEELDCVLGFLLSEPPSNTPHLLVGVHVTADECGWEEHTFPHRDVKVGNMPIVVLEVDRDQPVLKLGVVLSFLHDGLQLVFCMVNAGTHHNVVSLPRHLSEFDDGDESHDDLTEGLSCNAPTGVKGQTLAKRV